MNENTEPKTPLMGFTVEARHMLGPCQACISSGREGKPVLHIHTAMFGEGGSEEKVRAATLECLSCSAETQPVLLPSEGVSLFSAVPMYNAALDALAVLWQNGSTVTVSNNASELGYDFHIMEFDEDEEYD